MNQQLSETRATADRSCSIGAHRHGKRLPSLTRGAEPGEVGRRDDDHREVGAECEQRAVGEVDELHHSDDEHEAKRDEREQKAEAQTVQEMGNDVRHGEAFLGMSALTQPCRSG